MSLPTGSAAVNWLWLAPLRGRERALVVAESADTWLQWLGRHFTWPEAAPLRALAFPFEAHRFDCVVLPGLIAPWDRAAQGAPAGISRSHIVGEARRVLKPGGVLLASGRNAPWPGGATAGWIADSRFRSALRQAGFRTVHAYFADPSDLMPRSIIPARRRTALAYERQEAVLRGRMPRLLATVGLHNLAYPARLLMAVA